MIFPFSHEVVLIKSIVYTSTYFLIVDKWSVSENDSQKKAAQHKNVEFFWVNCLNLINELFRRSIARSAPFVIGELTILDTVGKIDET